MFDGASAVKFGRINTAFEKSGPRSQQFFKTKKISISKLTEFKISFFEIIMTPSFRGK